MFRKLMVLVALAFIATGCLHVSGHVYTEGLGDFLNNTPTGSIIVNSNQADYANVQDRHGQTIYQMPTAGGTFQVQFITRNNCQIQTQYGQRTRSGRQNQYSVSVCGSEAREYTLLGYKKAVIEGQPDIYVGCAIATVTIPATNSYQGVDPRKVVVTGFSLNGACTRSQ